MRNILIISLLSTILVSCCAEKKNIATEGNASGHHASIVGATAPPVLVYKTKNDYSQNVPILLSDDKKEIVSYPAPSDLMRGDGFATPTPLEGGYLYDNRGIGENVAFLKFTYKEYANRKPSPSLSELYGAIIDNDPLTELWRCPRIPSESINDLIRSGEFKTQCKQLK